MNLTIQKLEPIEINLLQMNAMEDKKKGKLFPILALLIAVTGGALTGWLWIDAKHGLSDAKKELENVNIQVAAAQLLLEGAPNTASLSEFLPLADQIRTSRPYSSDVLDKLAALVPADGNLGAVSFDDTQTVKVTGLFSTTDSVISFMQALKSDPAFTYVGMSGITKVQPDKKDAVNGAEMPLAAVQASFDLKYNGNVPQKKG
jgi:Tfp pilus assembly protein PilN